MDGVLDAQDGLPCDASVSALIFTPGENVQGTLLFEDMWPRKGDRDFNDVVLNYNYVHKADSTGVVSIYATFDVLALGALFDNSLNLHLPVATSAVQQVRRRINGGAWQTLSPSMADTELTITVEPFLRGLFGGVADQINTLASVAQLPTVRIEVEISLTQPTAFDTTQSPYDVFIARADDPSHQIHRTMYAGTNSMNAALFNTVHDGSTPSRRFVDTVGVPFVLEVPQYTEYPAEGVAISALFPDITNFGYWGGTLFQDFYVTPVAVAAYADMNGYGVPPPVAIAPAVIDESCLADPVPVYNVASWGGGCLWGITLNASWNGGLGVSFAGAGISSGRHIQFDYGVPTPVSGIAANAYSTAYRLGGWRNFHVSYLDPNGVWVTAYSGTHPNSGGTIVTSFPMQTARYWRFYMDSVYMNFSTSCGYGQYQGIIQLQNP